MNTSNVYEVSSPAIFDLEDSASFDAISNRLRATRDLATDFSLIGQEIGLQSQVKFRVVLEGKSQLLAPLVYQHAYRIGHEALLNAFRHSQASRIDLYLAHTSKGLYLTIRDNGQGISLDTAYCCNGLSWMKILAQRIGASLKLLTRDKAGTEVLLAIPGHIAFATETRGGALAAA
jgi:signal transduction histidine kinase